MWYTIKARILAQGFDNVPRIARLGSLMDLQTFRMFVRRLRFLLSHVPAGARGELTIAQASLSIVHTKANGERRDLGVVSRKKVTQAFVKRLAAQMAVSFAGADPWKYHDCGTGVAAESNADTALGTPYGGARAVGTQVDSSSGANGGYTSVGTISFTSTLAITEHGLFNAAAVGTLLDRSVFTAVNVVNGDSIQFTYVLTIAPEA